MGPPEGLALYGERGCLNWLVLAGQRISHASRALKSNECPKIRTDALTSQHRGWQNARGYCDYAIEQDHRGIKHRYYPMRGFGSFASAARCCPAFAELRQYFRAVNQSDGRVSLAERRLRHRERWAAVMAELAAA